MADNASPTGQSGFVHMLQSRLHPRPPVDIDPRLLSSRQKGIILLMMGLCASTAGFASTIYFPGMPAITADFKASSMNTTLTAALFVLFMGITPVFWSSISDHFKVRRILFILAMIIFAMASLGAALVQNIGGLIVLRCLQAVGSSCGQSVGAGVIADCYPVEKRGAAFGKYFFGIFFGPLIGPVIGGFLVMSQQSWRATFWFCLAFGLSLVVSLFFLLPETYRENSKFDAPACASKPPRDHDSVVTTTDVLADGEVKEKEAAANPSTAPSPQPTKRINPLEPALLLRHPFVAMAAFVSGIAFGAMFAVETIIPDLYEAHYGFSSWKTGLSFLGAGVGNVIGSICNTFLSDRLLMRARARRGGAVRVEDRITVNAWPCGIIVIPFGLLLFGWSIKYDLSVWAAIVGFGIQNFGMNQIMTMTSAYLVDAVPGKGATVTASANLMRMIFACILTLVANPMVSALGPGWTAVLFAALTWASVVVLFFLKLYGHRLRRWSGYEQANEKSEDSSIA